MLAGSYQNTFRGSNSLFFDSENVGTEGSATLKKLNLREFSEEQKRYGIHAKMDFKLNKRNKFEWYNAFLNLSNAQTRDIKSTELSFGYQPTLGNANLSYSTRSRFTKQQIFNSTLQGEHELFEDFTLKWW